MTHNETERALEEAFNGVDIDFSDGDFNMGDPFVEFTKEIGEVSIDATLTLPQLNAIVAFMEAE